MKNNGSLSFHFKLLNMSDNFKMNNKFKCVKKHKLKTNEFNLRLDNHKELFLKKSNIYMVQNLFSITMLISLNHNFHY